MRRPRLSQPPRATALRAGHRFGRGTRDGHDGLDVPLRPLDISGERWPFNCPRPVYASLLSLPSWPWLLAGYAVRQVCPRED